MLRKALFVLALWLVSGACPGRPAPPPAAAAGPAAAATPPAPATAEPAAPAVPPGVEEDPPTAFWTTFEAQGGVVLRFALAVESDDEARQLRAALVPRVAAIERPGAVLRRAGPRGAYLFLPGFPPRAASAVLREFKPGPPFGLHVVDAKGDLFGQPLTGLAAFAKETPEVAERIRAAVVDGATRLTAADPADLGRYLAWLRTQSAVPSGRRLGIVEGVDFPGGGPARSVYEALVLHDRPVLDGRHIVRATAEMPAQGMPYVAVWLNSRGALQLDEATREYVGGRLAIVHGPRVLMAPTVMEPIRNGRLHITLGAAANVAEGVHAMTRAAELADELARAGKNAGLDLTSQVSVPPGGPKPPAPEVGLLFEVRFRLGLPLDPAQLGAALAPRLAAALPGVADPRILAVRAGEALDDADGGAHSVTVETNVQAVLAAGAGERLGAALAKRFGAGSRLDVVSDDGTATVQLATPGPAGEREAELLAFLQKEGFPAARVTSFAVQETLAGLRRDALGPGEAAARDAATAAGRRRPDGTFTVALVDLEALCRAAFAGDEALVRRFVGVSLLSPVVSRPGPGAK